MGGRWPRDVVGFKLPKFDGFSRRRVKRCSSKQMWKYIIGNRAWCVGPEMWLSRLRGCDAFLGRACDHVVERET